MSDRALWLAEWCPTCAASAGARCRALRVRGPSPAAGLHVARGWRQRTCPKCHALPGEVCVTPDGSPRVRASQRAASSRRWRVDAHKRGVGGARAPRREARGSAVQWTAGEASDVRNGHA